MSLYQLTEEEKAVCRSMGQSEADYLELKKAEAESHSLALNHDQGLMELSLRGQENPYGLSAAQRFVCQQMGGNEQDLADQINRDSH